jgi:hypothetical protein
MRPTKMSIASCGLRLPGLTRRNRQRVIIFGGRHHDFRQPKIKHLDRAIPPELDVRGLQVAMDDVPLVRRFERCRDLLGDRQRLPTMRFQDLDLNGGSRHGNPIQVALHALPREGVYVRSGARHNVAQRNDPRSRQLQDLLLRRKPMDDTFGHHLARGQ